MKKEKHKSKQIEIIEDEKPPQEKPKAAPQEPQDRPHTWRTRRLQKGL